MEAAVLSGGAVGGRLSPSPPAPPPPSGAPDEPSCDEASVAFAVAGVLAWALAGRAVSAAPHMSSGPLLPAEHACVREPKQRDRGRTSERRTRVRAGTREGWEPGTGL